MADDNQKKPTPPGTKKPALPPGLKKPAGPQRHEAGRPAEESDARDGDEEAHAPAEAGRPERPPGAKPAHAARHASSSRLPAGGDGAPPELTRKDFASDADVRWCPGCGDYAVLAAVQRVLPELTEDKAKTSCSSAGIGCSSRFPYYMNTYGVHSIHGRAPTVATGLKCADPELDVWIITGDGDALSIGGNHFIHLLRRNLDLQVILFNNQIYGLTKGQYSPTSEPGKVTKSSPYGSLDHPFNPAALALGADATFVARTLDRDPKHMQEMLRAAHGHARHRRSSRSTRTATSSTTAPSSDFTERDSKPHTTLFVEHGQPLVYDEGTKGLRLDGLKLEAIDLTSGAWSADDCLVYDATDRTLAGLVGRIFWQDDLPQPVRRVLPRGATDLRAAPPRAASRRHREARAGRPHRPPPLRRNLDHRIALTGPRRGGG